MNSRRFGEDTVTKQSSIQRESLTRQAVRAIRGAIFAGDYTPGQRLMEEDVAERFGVSRNVVREAFYQLEAEGLLWSEYYRGKSVTSLSKEDMAELIPLRLLMESLAATWAARNITPESAAELRNQAAKFSQILKTFSDYAGVDYELHQMIWRLAGNQYMEILLNRLAGPMIGLQSHVYTPHLDEIIKKELEFRDGSHGRIVEAICAGSPTEARMAMQKHILSFWQLWLTSSSTLEEEGVRKNRLVVSDAVGLIDMLTSVLDTPKAVGTVKVAE
jgi:DNA-binding GntR family transcriptional regulator